MRLGRSTDIYFKITTIDPEERLDVTDLYFKFVSRDDNIKAD
jgi:hypothetical protein